jgi:photosystem II stability/assembly factor-like uncharacterized protein
VYVYLAVFAVTILTIVSTTVYSNDDSPVDSSSITNLILDLKANPHNKNELYAIVARKGLYRSIDKGDTWIYCDTGLPVNDDESIREIAFDPIENVIYAIIRNNSTSTGALYKSCDFKNWVKLGEFKGLSNVFIKFTGQSHVFIQSTGQSKILYVRGGGLHASVNGRTWEKIDVPGPYYHADAHLYPVAIDRVDPSIVYFALLRSRTHFYNDNWDGSGIYKSSDQGKTMKKILSTTLDVLVNSSNDANVMYSADEIYPNKNHASRILKSTDGGASWEVQGKLEQITVEKLFMSPVDHNILYAITVDRRHLQIINYDLVKDLESDDIQAKQLLLRSSNGGKTWQDISLGAPFNNKNYVTTIVPDSLNPEVLHVGAAYGLFKSEDAGKTWKAIQMSK